MVVARVESWTALHQPTLTRCHWRQSTETSLLRPSRQGLAIHEMRIEDRPSIKVAAESECCRRLPEENVCFWLFLRSSWSCGCLASPCFTWQVASSTWS